MGHLVLRTSIAGQRMALVTRSFSLCFQLMGVDGRHEAATRNTSLSLTGTLNQRQQT